MNRVVAFSIFFYAFSLLPPGASRAQESVPADDESVAVSTSVFLRKSTAPPTLDAVLAHFELFDRNLTALSAHFTQTLTVPETGMRSSVEGAIAYRKPQRLRIEHVRPERQTVVADGDDLWIHRHSHAQVIQSKLEDWKNADPTLSNLMQFGSYGKMIKTYDVSLDTAAAAPALVLRSKSKTQPDFTLRMELDDETLFPRVMELIVGSMRVRTRLDDIRFNPELKKSDFIFTPPPDADVFRNFKPPKLQP